MLDSELEKLKDIAAEEGYLSFAVNGDGMPVTMGPVPWERTLSAFNMRHPKVTLAKEDLQDEEIMGLVRQCRVIGCYLFAPLSDYGWIAGLPELEDLSIYGGEGVKDLSFTRHLPDLFLFLLEGAKIPDLKDLVDNCNEGQSGPGKCFCFVNCEVEDTSALREVDFTLSELLVHPADGDTAGKWETGKKPGVFRFYG